jgi:SAM-dependent methyltransferase
VQRGNPELSFPWVKTEASFRRRGYGSYEEYVTHQVAKLGKIDLRHYDEQYRAVLRERMEKLGRLRRGDTVLCLGARIGTECKAFIDLGCFSIGIDLNPGPDNNYVVHGDFHALQFADASIDYVFTNSLDHAFDLTRIVREVVRVLQPGGQLLAEVVGGSKDSHGREPGEYESLWWDKASDVLKVITGAGLTMLSSEKFEYPWGGELVTFLRPDHNLSLYSSQVGNDSR